MLSQVPASPRLTVTCVAEHGAVEDLASPVLSKIAEAFVFSKKSMFASDPAKGNGVIGEGSIVIGLPLRRCAPPTLTFCKCLCSDHAGISSMRLPVLKALMYVFKHVK